MTNIQEARDVLDKWRSNPPRPGEWAMHDYPRIGIAEVTIDGRPLAEADTDDEGGTAVATMWTEEARLIVGTAGNPELLDAIDGLLGHVWKYPAWTNGHMRTYAERLAAAIIAADERMNA